MIEHDPALLPINIQEKESSIYDDFLAHSLTAAVFLLGDKDGTKPTVTSKEVISKAIELADDMMMARRETFNTRGRHRLAHRYLNPETLNINNLFMADDNTIDFNKPIHLVDYRNIDEEDIKITKMNGKFYVVIHHKPNRNDESWCYDELNIAECVKERLVWYIQKSKEALKESENHQL